jgi:A/G-specific adenine glycosylase
VGIASDLNAWFGREARDLPWRAPGFTAWGILVSEVMLQQTQVDRVIPQLARWLERWPTPGALAASPAGEAVRAWGRLGYPRRALRLHAAAIEIVQRHGGAVPSDVSALLALPGIGTYTARAVAAFAHGVRTPVVDTNVRRVLARALLGQGDAGPPAASRDLVLMESVLPLDPVEAKVTNAAVMELGAVICTSRAPACDRCPIARDCAWRLAGYPSYQGPRRRVQGRFEGSDRQARGAVLAQLRAAELPLGRDELSWPDPDQLDRAVAGLVRDGLATQSDGGLSLPR